MNPDAIESWPDPLEAAARATRCFDRVRILRDTASTQDAARAAAGGRPGLIVTAGRQSQGRGQLGRRWVQGGDLGIAATFVVAAAPSQRLSQLAGLAAFRACCDAIPNPDRLRIKPPNDIVATNPSAPDGRQKLAGILIEQADGLAMIGIGINVLQAPSDFPGDLRATACSLHMLGAPPARLPILLSLVREIDNLLALPDHDITTAWHAAVIT